MYNLISRNSPTWLYTEEMGILYKAFGNTPLIQKDSRTFDSYFIPNFDANQVKIYRRLLARNFDNSGEISIDIEPEFKFETETIEVFKADEIRTDETISEYFTNT